MKNILYYILIYVLLSFFTGVLYFFFQLGYLTVFLLATVALGAGSCFLDTYRVRKVTSSGEIFYIRRCFLNLNSLYYYKSLFLKILSALLGAYGICLLFSIEDNVSVMIIFFCLFMLLYVNFLPMFFVVIDARCLTLYLERRGNKDIYIEKHDETQSSCYLGYRDLKKMIRLNNEPE